jgi:exodeoxyribonuclease VII large subunit
LNDAWRRLERALKNADHRRSSRVDALRRALQHLDPTRVLGRGYSIVRDGDGHVVSTSAGLAKGAKLDILFAEGGAEAEVTRAR